MKVHLFFLAIVMGGIMSVYIPMIAQSARVMGAPIMGNVPFFFIAFLSSVAIAFASGMRSGEFLKIADVPAWLFLAGVMSALIIVGATFLVPRIGTGALFVMLVTGQILAGMLINHFGLLGVPVQSINLPAALGAILVIVGAGMVTFYASPN